MESNSSRVKLVYRNESGLKVAAIQKVSQTGDNDRAMCEMKEDGDHFHFCRFQLTSIFRLNWASTACLAYPNASALALKAVILS